MSLAFDEPSHTYRWNGQVVPGITSLLASLQSFASVPPDVLEAAQERGTDTHNACQFYDEDDIDEVDLLASQPDTWARLQGWKRFLLDCQPNWSLIEEPVYHGALRYAGRPDRIGELTLAGIVVPNSVVEIKTSATKHPVWGVQTMAQAKAAGLPDTARRFTVQLLVGADGLGTYKLEEWKDPTDWPVFVSLVTLNQWKRSKNL